MKDFPILSYEFDYVQFNLYTVDQEKYSVVAQYYMSNDAEKKFDAGFGLQTAIMGTSYFDCAQRIDQVIKSGWFVQSVSAFGEVIDSSDGSLIEEINWNDVFSAGEADFFSQLSNLSDKPTLH